LDLDTGSAVRDAIRRALDGGHLTSLTVDLGEVTFMDCAGLGTLIQGRRLADEHRVAYRVRNATGTASTVLRVTGTSNYLNAAANG
jgi:anti-anti-sigma factor